MANGTTPAPINVIPRGLLSLLDIKSLGRNPVTLNEGWVQGVLDLSEYYMSHREYVRAVTAAFSLPGFQAAQIGAFVAPFELPVVPNDQVWLVHRYSVRALNPLAAATTYNGVACAFAQTGTGSVGAPPVFIISRETDATTAEIPACGTEWSNPRLFTPGAFFGVHIESVTIGTGEQFDCAIEITRLRI